jgi:hypothetical protein
VKIALLDTNLLLALAWPNHQHHATAHEWFARHAKRGWATCAFTQLGFIRLSSNPAYSPDAVSPQDAAELLQQWTRHKAHHFWNSPAADVSAIYSNALGHQQVNDAWLVEVARRNKGKLVTFDTRLSAHAAEKDLVETIIS